MKRYYDVDICKAVGNPEDEDYESIYTEAGLTHIITGAVSFRSKDRPK